MIAGRNRVSADAKTVAPLGAEAMTPQLAIDMGQLGGMYSGHIRMIGTEAGWECAIRAGICRRRER